MALAGSGEGRGAECGMSERAGEGCTDIGLCSLRPLQDEGGMDVQTPAWYGNAVTFVFGL